MYKKVLDWYNNNAQIYAKNSADLLYAQLDTFLSFIKTDSTIADIGSGIGQDTRYFIEKGYHSIGYDVSDGMLNIARKRGGNFVKWNILERPLPNKADAVWASSLLTHILSEDVDKVLKNIYNSLRNGGIFAIIVRTSGGSDMVRSYKKDDIKEKVFGLFQILKVSFFIYNHKQWLFIVMKKQK